MIIKNHLSRFRHARSAPKGFTLVEMMVAVTIFIILIGWGIPGMQSLFRSSQLASASNEALSLIYLARSESIQLRRRVIICNSENITAATPSCSDADGSWNGVLVFVDENSDGGLDAGERILRVWAPPSDLDFNPSAAIGDASNSVTFRPDGLARNEDGALLEASLSVCIPETKPGLNIRRLMISSGGKVNLRRESGDGACPTPANG